MCKPLGCSMRPIGYCIVLHRAASYEVDYRIKMTVFECKNQQMNYNLLLIWVEMIITVDYSFYNLLQRLSNFRHFTPIQSPRAATVLLSWSAIISSVQLELK